MRPVLCLAAPFTPNSNSSNPVRAAPPMMSCAPEFRATASNLNVVPDVNTAAGFKSKSPRADPAFSHVRSTPRSHDTTAVDVLLPSSAGTGDRYVLGPAGFTSSMVHSATAVDGPYGWEVTITCTDAGARAWDALAARSFHAEVAAVVNGEVVAAALIQPTQGAFTSFSGEVEVAGLTSKSEAEALATELD